MRKNYLIKSFIITIYSFLSLIIFAYMNLNEASKLALVEVYNLLKNFDFNLAVNVNTILFLPCIPLYFIKSSLRKFLLASLFALLLLLTFSGWLYAIIAVVIIDQLDFEVRTLVYRNLLIQVILVVAMNLLFELDIEVSLIFISSLYLLFLKRNVLVDFVVAIWLINAGFSPVMSWLLLPFLSISILKEIIINKRSDYIRSLFWGFLLAGVAREWVALSFLVLLVSSKHDELGLNYKIVNTFSIVFITFALVLLNLPIEMKIFLTGGLLVYLFEKEPEVNYGY